MASVKSIARSATVAWSPLEASPGLMCAGTVAGADAFAAPSLELLSVDLAAPSPELQVLGQVPIDDRVERLSWGTKGVADGQFPAGLLAGGMVDGTVAVWNPATIMGGGAGSPVVMQDRRHAGPVRGCQFNPYSSHLLATGSTKAELAIWDLTNPAQPSVLKPEARSRQTDDISHLAWNCKFQHILATTASDGVTVVWDLKVKRPVIAISDPNRRVARCSSVAWNPEDATKLTVASDDDNCPVLQVWDLRKAFQPIKEMCGHSKGILSISWCPLDPEMLLSCGKDGRNLCWDPMAGEIVSELPGNNGNWCFDVQWSPGLPAIVSECSFDGTCAPAPAPASDFLGQGSPQQLAQQPAPVSKRAPKWLRRPSGATFGFGGQLASFGSGHTAVQIRQVAFDDELVQKADSLERALSDPNERPAITAFCDQKLTTASAGLDQDTWSLLKLYFQEQPRAEMLKFIGYTLPQRGAAPLPAVAAPAPAPPDAAASAPEQSAEELFGSLAATAEDSSVAAHDASAARAQRVDKLADEPAVVVPAESWSSTEDGASIKRALIVGDYETAVESCLRAGRTADALVLAASRSEKLWIETRDRYLAQHQEPFMQVVARIQDNRLDAVVDSADLGAWQETLAILLTFADATQLSTLAEELGLRLFSAGDMRGANTCFMCAGNVEKAVGTWTSGQDGSDSTSSLQALIEKVCVFQKSTRQDGVDERTAQKYCEYAEALAAQGRVDIAMKYMHKATSSGRGGSQNEATAVLLDRLHHNGAGAGLGLPAPPSPYTTSTIGSGRPAAQPATHHTGGGYSTAQPIAGYGGSAQPTGYSPYNQRSYNAAAAPAPMPTMIPAPAPAPPPPPAPAPLQTFDHSVAAAGGGGSSYSTGMQSAPAPAPAAPGSQQYPPPHRAASAPPPSHSAQQAGVYGGYSAQQSPSASGAYGTGPAAMGRGQASSAPPPAAAAPVPKAKATVETADTANVPAHYKVRCLCLLPSPPTVEMCGALTRMMPCVLQPIVATLTRMYQQSASTNTSAVGRRKMEDVNKRLGQLFERLNHNDISGQACDKLLQLCTGASTSSFTGPR
jgi:protein transport protein SEC31